MKKNKENNYAFIDSQNLNLGVKSQRQNKKRGIPSGQNPLVVLLS